MSAPSETLRFPEELRLGSGLPQTRGRLAHATVSNGALHCTIDGMRAVVRSSSPFVAAPKATSGWQYGLELEQEADAAPPAPVQRVFVAPEHALVAVEWEANAPVELTVEASLDEGLRARASDGEHTRGRGASTWTLWLGAGESVRFIITPEAREEPPLAALFASAIARTRRRAASRPSLIRTGSVPADPGDAYARDGTDAIASLEHAMRTARDPDADLAGAIRVAFAMLALNDPEPAFELLADRRAAAFHPALLGALAAWSGATEALIGYRAGYVEWLRSELASIAAGAVQPADESARGIRHVALAFAPAAVELLGEQVLAAALRNVTLPDGRDALTRLARGAAAHEADRAAASVLGLFHGSMGISPDAPRGRVRIGPRLAPGETMRLERLRVGEAVFRVHASMAHAGLARMRVEQTAGAAPNTLIMEPWLPATRLHAALVDGATAELDFARAGEGIRPHVQLVADHAREIVLRFE